MSYIGSNHSSSQNLTDDEQENLRVHKPPIRLSEHAQTLSHILRHHDMPLVAQCAVGALSALSSSASAVDFSKPLLFYKRRSVRKVSAHSLIFDPESKEFKGVGNNLAIPEDYRGYFAVLGHPDQCHTDHMIPYFRLSSKLAISPCTEFLVGGDRPVNALRVEGGMQSSIKPIPCQLYPGEVMRKGGIFEATSKVLTKGKGLFARKKFEERKECFLQCFDIYDREVLLPENTAGTFVVLAQDGANVKCPVVCIKDLLERFRLPVIVKLVYGRAPATPCSFTGTLLLCDSGMDKTVIASTLLNLRNINLEIPINSSMRFHVAEPSPGLLGSRAYENACKMCQQQADTYMRNMKVCYDRAADQQQQSPNLQTRPGQSEPSVEEESNNLRSRPSSVDSTSSTASGESKHSAASSGAKRALPPTPAPALPSRTASIISRTSVWGEITSSVNVCDREHDIFVPPSQKTPPPERTLLLRPQSGGKVKKEETKLCENMKELLVFQKPKPPVADVIPISQGPAATAQCVNDSESLIRDGTLSSDEGLYGYETLSRNSMIVPPTPNNEPCVYLPLWQTERGDLKRDSQPEQTGSNRSPQWREEPTLPQRTESSRDQDPGYMIQPRFVREQADSDTPKATNEPRLSASPRVEAGRSPSIDLAVSPPPPTPRRPQSKGLERSSSEDNWHAVSRERSLASASWASFDAESADTEDSEGVIYQNLASLRRVDKSSVEKHPNTSNMTGTMNTSQDSDTPLPEATRTNSESLIPGSPRQIPPIPSRRHSPTPENHRPTSTQYVQPDSIPPIPQKLAARSSTLSLTADCEDSDKQRPMSAPNDLANGPRIPLRKAPMPPGQNLAERTEVSESFAESDRLDNVPPIPSPRSARFRGDSLADMDGDSDSLADHIPPLPSPRSSRSSGHSPADMVLDSDILALYDRADSIPPIPSPRSPRCSGHSPIERGLDSDISAQYDRVDNIPPIPSPRSPRFSGHSPTTTNGDSQCNQLDKNRFSFNAYQPLTDATAGPYHENTFPEDDVANIYEELDYSVSDPDPGSSMEVERREASAIGRRMQPDSGVYMSNADIPVPPRDEKLNIPSSTSHGISVLNELQTKMDSQDHPSALQSPKSPISKVSTFAFRGDVPPRFPSQTRPWSCGPPAGANMKNKTSSVPLRNSYQGKDVLENVDNAGLQPKTVIALRELSQEKMSSFLQGEIEMEELRDLLPSVTGIQLRKVLMFLKTSKP